MIKMRVKSGSILDPSVRRRKFDKLKKEVLNKKVMTDLAEKTEDIVYKRVKSGYGVKGNTKGRLKPLTPKYKKFRKGKALGDFGTPNKSNLTLTGQMLKAFGRSVTKNTYQVFIKATGRTKITGGRDRHTNKKIAEYVSKLRPFLSLSKPEVRVIISEFRQHVKDVARKIFN
jgi:hypothetical protein